MMARAPIAVLLLLAPSAGAANEAPPAGRFESLGQPVSLGRLHQTSVGPDREGRTRRVYQAFGQAGKGGAFLLVTDPSTGVSEQHFLPRSTRGARGIKTVFPHDGVVYAGSYQSTYLLRFDPRNPDDGLQICGDGPLDNATMIWQILPAADGRLYFTTSGEDCRLFSYDPESNAIADRGPLSPGNRYAQEMVASSDGRTLYIAVGTREHDVIAYDVQSGRRRSLLPEERRNKGFLSLRPGSFVGKKNIELAHGRLVKDGLYAVPHSNAYAIELDARGAVVSHVRPDRTLDDGRRVVVATGAELVLEGADGSQETIPLKYRAGAQLMTFWAAGERVYFSTTAPLRVGYYDPRSDRVTMLGNPLRHAGGNVKAACLWQGKMILAAYAGTDLALYDPARAWNKGSTPEHNPWTWGYADGTLSGHYARHTHPVAVVVGSDGLVYVATEPDRGRPGGLVCLDPTTGKALYEEPIPVEEKSRTPTTLAADSRRPILYRGHRDGRVTAWNARRREVLWETTPVPRPDGQGRTIAALRLIDDVLVGTTRNSDEPTRSTFFRLASDGRVIARAPVAFGGVIRDTLPVGPDGWLYGISRAGERLYRIDPQSGEAQHIADAPPGSQSYGLAVTGQGLYFAKGGELMRYRFDRPLTARATANGR